MITDAYYIVPHVIMGLLMIGFLWFIFEISPDIRKMIKRNRKIKRRLRGIKEASKARDYQI